MRLSQTTLPLLITFAYYIAFIALGLTDGALGATLPGLADQALVTVGQASLFLAARSLGRLAGSYAGGHVLDRMRGHPLLTMALLVMAVGMLAISSVSLFELMLLAFLLAGLGEGALDACANTLLVWLHRDRVDPYMNGLHFFYALGAFVAPLIVAQLITQADSITLIYRILTVLMLPGVVLLVWLPSPEAPEPARKRKTDSPQATAGSSLTWLAMGFFALYVSTEVSFGGWIVAYALELNLVNPETGAYLASAFWGAFLVGRLLSIPLATRLMPRTILTMDLTAGAVSLVLLLIGTVVLPEMTVLLWIGTMGMGFSIASVFPTMLSFLEKRVTMTGRFTGRLFVAAGVGATLVPPLIGQLFELAGPVAIMLTILVTTLLSLVIFLVMLRTGTASRAALLD